MSDVRGFVTAQVAYEARYSAYAQTLEELYEIMGAPASSATEYDFVTSGAGLSVIGVARDDPSLECAFFRGSIPSPRPYVETENVVYCVDG